jgi:hypothetical protein
MLLIFYLQNLSKPMLDSIKNNQTGKPPSILDSKYKWNFYFNDGINKSSQNSDSFRVLLEGFFEFYFKLNYANYVLSLYTGTLIQRQQFGDHPDLELYREVVSQSNGEIPEMKVDNPQTFIVQDGFEQNLNIGIKVTKHLETFFELVK